MLLLLASLAHAADPAPIGAVEPAPDATRAPPPSQREDRSDFVVGDVDLRLGVGFHGVEPAPWTLVTSLAGWNALEIGVDAAVLTSDEATVSLGVEAFYSKPLLHQAVSRVLFAGNDFNEALAWRAADRGALARAALHVTSFSSVDAYGAFLIGPSFFTFEADRLGGPHAGSTHRVDVAGLRTGVAGGLAAVSGNRFLGGVELRYLVNARFRSARELVVGEGDTAEVFELGSRHTGPSGFTWSLFVGRRL